MCVRACAGRGVAHVGTLPSPREPGLGHVVERAPRCWHRAGTGQVLVFAAELPNGCTPSGLKGGKPELPPCALQCPRGAPPLPCLGVGTGQPGWSYHFER